jgi:hypothetical protein
MQPPGAGVEQSVVLSWNVRLSPLSAVSGSWLVKESRGAVCSRVRICLFFLETSEHRPLMGVKFKSKTHLLHRFFYFGAVFCVFGFKV